MSDNLKSDLNDNEQKSKVADDVACPKDGTFISYLNSTL
jgi:hypothetical protein